jgi:hypothetical protein
MCSFKTTCKSLALFVATGIAWMACSHTTVRVRPYAPGETDSANHGAVYHLPKALLQTAFTVKLILRPASNCADSPANCARLVLAEGDATIEKPTLETLSIPDPAAAFVIHSPGSFMLKTTFAAQFNEKGELTSAKSTSSNQVLEFAAWGLETIGTVAKAVAAAGATPEADRRNQKAKRRLVLEQALASLDEKFNNLANGDLLAPKGMKKADGPKKSETTGDVASSVANASAEIDKIITLRNKIQSEITTLDSELVKTLSIPVTCLLDPSSRDTFHISESGGDCPAYAAVKTALTAAQVNVKSPLPELTVTLAGLGAKQVTASTMQETHGFVYRIPAWFHAEITSEHSSQIQKILAIPQRGQLAVFGLDDDDLLAGKTIEVSLHPSLGMLSAVKLNGEPIDLDSARKLVGSATGLATLNSDMELARAQKQSALAEAQAKYLQDMADLEKAKKDLEKAKTSE